MNSFGFNMGDYANTNDTDTGSFSPIPQGEYDLLVDRAEITQSKKGFDMLKMTLRVVGSEYEGRLVFENMCYGHPNEKTQTIARRTMSSIQRALGKECKNAEDFVGGMFRAFVKVTPAQGQYGPSNAVGRIVNRPAVASSSTEENGNTGNARPW
jgi:hypothetical protein